MSKKRSPSQEREYRESTIEQRNQQGSADHELALGNQAVQRGMTEAGVPVPDFEQVTNAALPVVEQALLAVQLQPRDATLTNRLVDTLTNSSLSEERRDAILGRLQEDQAVADAVQAALENAFGLDSDGLREALWSSLDRTWTALMEGEVRHGEDMAEGQSVSQRASALVGELAAQNRDERLDALVDSRSAAPAIQQFCRSIALLLHWEDDEEEEWGASLEFE